LETRDTEVFRKAERGMNRCCVVVVVEVWWCGVALVRGALVVGPWNDGREKTQGRSYFDVRLMFEGQVRFLRAAVPK